MSPRRPGHVGQGPHGQLRCCLHSPWGELPSQVGARQGTGGPNEAGQVVRSPKKGKKEQGEDLITLSKKDKIGDKIR